MTSDRWFAIADETYLGWFTEEHQAINAAENAVKGGAKVAYVAKAYALVEPSATKVTDLEPYRSRLDYAFNDCANNLGAQAQIANNIRGRK